MNDFENDVKHSGCFELDKYTFDSFIVGETNKFAYDAALAVAEGSNNSRYNPLFIFGESGLGKTHLLHAVRHLVKRKYPDSKVVYVKCDDFVEELALSIKNKKKNEFREKYSAIDILLMDDTQNLAEKPAIQHELLYIYNTLREQNKQMIFTSNKSVSEMFHVVDTLRTRLISGLPVEIQPPDITFM
jgi:chromosomal replication initiator protein